MHITRFRDPAGTICFGIDRGDGKAELLANSPLTGPIEPTGKIAVIHERLAPLMPTNIFCIGLNYRAHAEETGSAIPTTPVVFMKPVSAVNDPGKPIRLPKVSHEGGEVDYECELAVVIGKAGRDIPESQALDHVLGYTVANDVSARKWQKQSGGGQWIRGKGFDTFCPLGPVLVTAGNGEDEIADPQALEISTTIDGQIMQQSSTSDMIFTVAQLIAFLSQDTTLLPGTVILTGTPQGVGVARDPKLFLKQGMNVTVAIKGIGEVSNPVVDAS